MDPDTNQDIISIIELPDSGNWDDYWLLGAADSKEANEIMIATWFVQVLIMHFGLV